MLRRLLLSLILISLVAGVAAYRGKALCENPTLIVIVLHSNRDMFPVVVMDSVPSARIGEQVYLLGYGVDPRRAAVWMRPEDFAALPDGAPISVAYGQPFAAFDKSQLRCSELHIYQQDSED